MRPLAPSANHDTAESTSYTVKIPIDILQQHVETGRRYTSYGNIKQAKQVESCQKTMMILMILHVSENARRSGQLDSMGGGYEESSEVHQGQRSTPDPQYGERLQQLGR